MGKRKLDKNSMHEGREEGEREVKEGQEAWFGEFMWVLIVSWERLTPKSLEKRNGWRGGSGEGGEREGVEL